MMVADAPSTLNATRPHRLVDAFLIAATINADLEIDLALVCEGRVDAYARVAFSVDGEGRVVQHRYGYTPLEPPDRALPLRRGAGERLDMILLAECLTGALGTLTPPLFRLAEPIPGAPRRLLFPGEENDRARLRLLHDAFSICLLAYEEHLL